MRIAGAAVLLSDEDYPKDVQAAEELEAGLPYIEMKLMPEEGFKHFTEFVFASDRRMVPKGIIELIHD